MQFHSQTFGILMGGANRKGEEVKLRKGVNLLIATPGRLIDHLEVRLVQSGMALRTYQLVVSRARKDSSSGISRVS